MNNKVSFLCPIYPPHFMYGKKLIKSFKNSNMNKYADLYFLFTNEGESKLFGEYPHKIFLPKDIEKNFYKGNTHFPDAKKLFGCNYLKNSYEYIIVLDAESKFIKDVDIYKICNEYFKNKILYGNTSDRGDMVIKSCLERFSNGENTEQNLDLYLRFNQPCIYKTEYLDDFFDKTGIYKDINKLKFGWFDYYIYMLYLIFYHKRVVKDIGVQTTCGFCESPGQEDIKEIMNDNWKKCRFLIATPYIYNMVKKYNNTIFILIQLNTERTFIKKFKWYCEKAYALLWKIFHGMKIFGIK